MKIAVFFHTLFVCGEPPEPMPTAITITHEQIETFKSSGLLDACQEFYVGINGAEESQVYADGILPEKAVKIYHGTQCHNELRTIMWMQEAMRGRDDWLVLYVHCKGASHPLTDQMSFNWRWCMMHNLVTNWQICVDSLNYGFDSVGCHWKTNQTDGTQSLWAGNYFWLKSRFLNTLPPIEKHPRIPSMGGIDAFASRYEAEVWIGTGRRLPKVCDYHPSGPFTCGQK